LTSAGPVDKMDACGRPVRGARTLMMSSWRLIVLNSAAAVAIFLAPVYSCAPRMSTPFTTLLAWALHSPWETAADAFGALTLLIDAFVL